MQVPCVQNIEQNDIDYFVNLSPKFVLAMTIFPALYKKVTGRLSNRGEVTAANRPSKYPTGIHDFGIFLNISIPSIFDALLKPIPVLGAYLPILISSRCVLPV